MTLPADTAPFHVLRDGAPAGPLTGAVVAIGNFDGVHRGHRAVLNAAITRARALGRPAAALTFEPHPRTFLHPEEPLFRLTPEPTKLRLLATTGLDGAIVLTFDAALASLTAEEFVTQILRGRLAVSGAAIGFNFFFGKNRAGSPEYLAAEGARHGFVVDIVPQLKDDGRPISSGPIRTALAHGRVEEAAAFLGYPWFVTGTVLAGAGRGRALGFPTANIRLDPHCGLRHGIYAIRAGLAGARYEGVASFGRRPTFDDGAPLLEVHLFDFARDLYGRTLDVAFIAWIREEERFESVDDLVRRMHLDSREARAALARLPDAWPPI